MHSKGLRERYIMAEGRRSQERGQRVGAAYTRQTPQFLPNLQQDRQPGAAPSLRGTVRERPCKRAQSSSVHSSATIPRAGNCLCRGMPSSHVCPQARGKQAVEFPLDLVLRRLAALDVAHEVGSAAAQHREDQQSSGRGCTRSYLAGRAPTPRGGGPGLHGSLGRDACALAPA